MRAYEILITDPDTGKLIQSFSSFNSGLFGAFAKTTNPGALNIEFDIPVFAQAQPAGNVMLKVWGIGIGTISQSANFNRKNITIYGGMAKGLPLAQPQQYGLLLQGTIIQCYGNWQDTNQTLDFVIGVLIGNPSAPNSPTNFVTNFQAGQQLAPAILESLKVAYKSNANMQFRDDTTTQLSFNAPYPLYAQNITQFSQQVKEASIIASNNLPNYPGIDITLQNETIVLSDGPSKKEPTQILYFDLIGQPTWYSLYEVQFKCVLRYDLMVMDTIFLPNSVQRTQAKTQSQYRQSSVFGGAMAITQLRHVGNFRQPSADSWVTIVNAVTLPLVNS